MSINIYTQTFQNTLEDFNNILFDKTNKGQQFADSEELQKKFVEQKGMNWEDFKSGYDEWYAATERGVKDFRGSQIQFDDNPETSVLEETAGTLLRIGGRTAEEFSNYLSLLPGVSGKTSLAASLPKEWQEYFDPYHGDGIQGTAENLGAQVATFIGGPVSWTLKGASAISKAKNLGKHADTIKKIMGSKKGKLGALGVTSAAHESIINNTDINALEEMVKSPEGLKILEALENNPDDRQLTNLAKNFAINLGIEGAFLGTGMGIVKGYKAFKNTKTGYRIHRLLQRNLSTRMGTNDKFHDEYITRKGAANKALVEATGIAKTLERSVTKNDKGAYEQYLKVNPTRYIDNLDMDIGTNEDVVTAALKGDAQAFDVLSKETRNLVTEMRTNIDDISQHLGDNVFKGKLTGGITKNLGVYLNRSYRIFDDGFYRKDIEKAANKYIDSIKKNKEYKPMTSKGEELKRVIDDAWHFWKKEFPNLTDDQLGKRLKDFLGKAGEGESDALFALATKGDSLLGTSKATKRLNNMPRELRALYGEIKNPYQSYINTMGKISVLKAENDFMSTIAHNLEKDGLTKWAATKADAPKTQDISWKSIQDLANDRASLVFGGPKNLRTIKGLSASAKKVYVSPEYVDALEKMKKESEKGGVGAALLKYWGAMKGITQAQATVYNPATHGRNVVGNMIFMVANGMVPFGKGSFTALQQTSARLNNQNDKDLNKLIGEMVGYGLADSSVTLGLVKDGFKKLTDESKFINSLKGEGKVRTAVRGAAFPAKYIAKLYEAEDFVFKVMHYEKTLDMLKKALPDMAEDEVKKLAARRTRDLMPNYNLVPQFFKNLRYMPIGDFAAFPAESTRIAKNLVKYTLDDLTSGVPALENAAKRRLAGMTSVAIIPEAAEDMSARLFDYSQEDQDAIKKVDAPFYAGSNKVFVGKKRKNSKGEIIADVARFGPFDPMDQVRVSSKFIHQALLSGMDWAGLGEPEKELFTKKAAVAMLDKTLGPFIGTSMITDALIETAGGRDRYAPNSKTGALLSHLRSALSSRYNIDIDEKYLKGASRVLSTFEPGFFKFLERRKEYERSLEAQRKREEALGIERTGKAFNKYNSEMAVVDIKDFAGLGTKPINLTTGVYFNVGKPLLNVNKLDSDYLSKWKDQTLSNEEGERLVNDYDGLQRTRKSELLDARRMIQTYRSLGFSNEDIENALSQKGMKKVSKELLASLVDLENNMYSSTKIPDSLYIEIYDNFGKDRMFGDALNLKTIKADRGKIDDTEK